jgi:large subunit ribosomal protein L13
MKTDAPKANQIQRSWYLVDATDMVLGRLATQVASILRGKNKPYFSPHLDTGDIVVVINADKIRLTGNKENKKTYDRFSGYPGGRTEVSFKRMKQEKPEEIIIHAIKGMLPKNILGRQMIQKLKVYAGPNHPHAGQKPQDLDLK